MGEFEIYLHDLTEQAQKDFLEFAGLESAEDGNYDVFPIATVPLESIERED